MDKLAPTLWDYRSTAQFAVYILKMSRSQLFLSNACSLLTSWMWSIAPFPILTGFDPLCPSKCVSSFSGKSFSPLTNPPKSQKSLDKARQTDHEWYTWSVENHRDSYLSVCRKWTPCRLGRAGYVKSSSGQMDNNCTVCLTRETKTNQGIEREGGITNPRRPVIPVSSLSCREAARS